MCDEATARRVLARRRDRELLLGLQELERIARALRALLLDDREHLVPQVEVAHVEQRLPRHRRVLHLFLVGDEGEDRFHQRRLARCRRRLDDDGERIVELARHRREQADELVDVLADDATTIEVVEDAIQEVRRAQEHQRFGDVVVGHLGRRRRPGRQRTTHRGVVLLFAQQQHAAEVALQRFLVDAEFLARLFHEDAALTRGVEVDGIDEESIVE